VDVPAGLGGPAQLVLTASVARRYYLDNRSKTELAEEFRISRFKVARLLEAARASGLVRIDIGWAGVIDVELSVLLQERFGLQHSVVIDAPDGNDAELRRQLGVAAADLLEEIVTGDDVLGLAWARSVSAMTGALRRLAATPVVQLTGALSHPDVEDSSIELVREVAQISGGQAYLFYAPLVVPDAATASALRGQPEVVRAFDQFDSVTKAVVGVGRWAPGQSTVYDATEDKERAQLARDGIVADVSGILLHADGSAVETRLTERMIGINAAQMRAIPQVIAIVYGAVKAPAVLAAVRSGVVKGLVTHTSMARAMLAAG
jgi:DNA-binding transcriptional regulator LsrR (DeoR family)